MSDKYEDWYRALKAVEPEAYQKAIQYAEVISLNFKMPLNQATEIEKSHVMLACELLGVVP